MYSVEVKSTYHHAHSNTFIFSTGKSMQTVERQCSNYDSTRYERHFVIDYLRKITALRLKGFIDIDAEAKRRHKTNRQMLPVAPYQCLVCGTIKQRADGVYTATGGHGELMMMRVKLSESNLSTAGEQSNAVTVSRIRSVETGGRKGALIGHGLMADSYIELEVKKKGGVKTFRGEWDGDEGVINWRGSDEDLSLFGLHARAWTRQGGCGKEDERFCFCENPIFDLINKYLLLEPSKRENMPEAIKQLCSYDLFQYSAKTKEDVAEEEDNAPVNVIDNATTGDRSLAFPDEEWLPERQTQKKSRKSRATSTTTSTSTTRKSHQKRKRSTKGAASRRLNQRKAKAKRGQV